MALHKDSSSEQGVQVWSSNWGYGAFSSSDYNLKADLNLIKDRFHYIFEPQWLKRFKV